MQLNLGHSGCNLKIIEKKQHTIIRKTSSSIKYNDRLEAQMIKQSKFVSKEIDIFSPVIFDYGHNKQGLFYFDMEFITGQTLSSYIVQTDLPAISFTISKLLTHIYCQKEIEVAPSKIFLDKIQVLLKKIENNNSIFNKSFELLTKFNWKNMCQSECHGDLTLENILITNTGYIYFIDFMDSFYNSKLMDIAKIMQDLEFGWAYRYTPDNNTRKEQLFFAKKNLLEKLKKHEKKENILVSIYHILLLNTLRIIPYTNEKKLLQKLEYSANKINNIIEEKRYNYV